MTAEKEPQTEAERKEAERLEKERLEKRLAVHPSITPPTGGKDARVFEPPIKIRGEPLSQTVIKERREARY